MICKLTIATMAIVMGVSAAQDTPTPTTMDNGVCDFQSSNSVCAYPGTTSGFIGFPPCSQPGWGSLSNKCYVQCLALNVTECAKFSAGGSKNYNKCEVIGGSCFNKCDQFKTSSSCTADATGCTWNYQTSSCGRACSPFSSHSYNSYSSWPKTNCPTASCDSLGGGCLQKCSKYTESYNCQYPCNWMGGKCRMGCQGHQKAVCDSISYCSYSAGTCYVSNCSMLSSQCNSLSAGKCVNRGNKCVATCASRDEASCTDSCMWDSTKKFCKLDCSQLDANSCYYAYEASSSLCSYSYKKQLCMPNCKALPADNMANAASCQDYPDLCAVSQGSCQLACNKIYPTYHSCQTEDCNWNTESNTCEVTCHAYNRTTCPAMGTDATCMLGYQGRCLSKCTASIPLATCILTKTNDCTFANDQCMQDCGSFAPGASCDGKSYCMTTYPPTSYGAGQCVSKCSALSYQYECGEHEHCLWSNDKCVMSCGQRKTAADCGEESAACMWSGGAICLPRCGADAYQVDQAACRGVSACTWDEVNQQCEFGSCTSLAYHFGWNSTWNYCDAVPYCKLGNYSYQPCVGACEKLNNQYQCNEKSGCYWSPNSKGCYSVCQPWEGTTSPDFTCNSYVYTPTNNTVQNAVCSQITDQLICERRTSNLDCAWVGGMCVLPCLFRNGTETECTNDGLCMYNGTACLPKKCQGQSEATCESSSACVWGVATQACAPRCSGNDGQGGSCFPYEINSGECMTMGKNWTNQARFDTQCFPNCEALDTKQCHVMIELNRGCNVWGDTCRTACDVFYGPACPSYCELDSTTGFCKASGEAPQTPVPPPTPVPITPVPTTTTPAPTPNPPTPAGQTTTTTEAGQTTTTTEAGQTTTTTTEAGQTTTTTDAAGTTTTTTATPTATTATAVVVTGSFTIGGNWSQSWLDDSTKKNELESALKKDLAKALGLFEKQLTITSLTIGSLKVEFSATTESEAKANSVATKASDFKNGDASKTFPDTYNFYSTNGGSQTQFQVKSSSAEAKSAPGSTAKSGLSTTVIAVIAVVAVLVVVVVLGVAVKVLGGNKGGTGQGNLQDSDQHGALLGESNTEMILRNKDQV